MKITGMPKATGRRVQLPAALDSECGVCGSPAPGHTHYGAAACCYSCRAFFRRTALRVRLRGIKRCRTGRRSCDLTAAGKCIHCRYQRCLDIGMSTEKLQGHRGKNHNSEIEAQNDDTKEECNDKSEVNITYGLSISVDELIRTYFNKKFKCSTVRLGQTQFPEVAVGTFSEIKILSGDLLSPVSSKSLMRKSVIVRREDAELQFIPMKVSVQMETECKEIQETVIPLNIEILENLYTIEEKNVFSNFLSEFKSHWLMSFGEEMMNNYISFCNRRQAISPHFMKTMNNHLRVRVIKCFKIMNNQLEIPQQVQLHLLRINLNKTLGLVQIHGFNTRELEDELSFVFSDQDWKQFSKETCLAKGAKIDEILRYSPLPVEAKAALLERLEESAAPVLGDHTVFCLLVMLVLLSGSEQVPQLVRARNQLENMLTRYLTVTYTSQTVQSHMTAVNLALHTLPMLAL